MRLKLVDFLKGYSIFTIVIYHIFQLLPMQGVIALAINFGGSGAHVFILCSGFGLCLSQLNKPLGYFNFLKNRFFKIYLPYIFVVLLSATITYDYIYNDKWLTILSHLFLFKMFNEEMMISYGYQLWFISTILQYYLVFSLLFPIVNKYRWKSVAASLIISLVWATFVWWIGKTDQRIWNSFFLQYLWEFVLGIMLAIRYKENPDFIKVPAIKYLLLFAIVCIAIVGYTGLEGGILKLYNDVPSLVGYLSVALVVYTIGTKIKIIENFFIFTNKFSYEWYLVHILVFITVFHFTKDILPIGVTGILALISSYVSAIIYHQILKKYLYPRI